MSLAIKRRISKTSKVDVSEMGKPMVPAVMQIPADKSGEGWKLFVKGLSKILEQRPRLRRSL